MPMTRFCCGNPFGSPRSEAFGQALAALAAIAPWKSILTLVLASAQARDCGFQPYVFCGSQRLRNKKTRSRQRKRSYLKIETWHEKGPQKLESACECPSTASYCLDPVSDSPAVEAAGIQSTGILRTSRLRQRNELHLCASHFAAQSVSGLFAASRAQRREAPQTCWEWRCHRFVSCPRIESRATSGAP